MTTSPHVHGTVCYRCEHPACRAAVSRYQKRWRYDVSHGRHRLVGVERVRNHLASLEAAGWSVRAIGEVADVPAAVVSRIRLGRQERMTRKVADALLALRPDETPERSEPRGFVPKLGTVRRLRALVALGWPAALLAEHVGEQTHWVYNRLNQSGLWVTSDVHGKVARLYDDLAMRLPPQETTAQQVAVKRARTAARKQGWLPPLALDDDRLDDPTYLPDENEDDEQLADDEVADYDHAVVERVLSEGRRPGRSLTTAEAVEVVRRLRARGVSTTDMERIYGLKPERFKEGATT